MPQKTNMLPVRRDRTMTISRNVNKEPAYITVRAVVQAHVRQRGPGLWLVRKHTR
jgi:hypothetical protein